MAIMKIPVSSASTKILADSTKQFRGKENAREDTGYGGSEAFRLKRLMCLAFEEVG